MDFFQAWGSPERPRLASNPTPIAVFRGGSAIMVVIRVPPREIPACKEKVDLGSQALPSPLAE
jgi:hypothetical protein